MEIESDLLAVIKNGKFHLLSCMEAQLP